MRESNFKTSRANFGHFGEETSDKEKKVGFNILATRASKEKHHNLLPNFVREASIMEEDEELQFK